MIYPRLKEQHKVVFIPHSYYHKKFASGHSMSSPHSHPYLEIMYCREGEVIIDFPTKNKNTGEIKNVEVALKEKQFIFIDAGIAHSIHVKEGQTAFVSNVEWKLIPMIEYSSSVKDVIQVDACNLFESLEGLKKFMNMPQRYIVSLDSENVEHCLVSYINLAIQNNNLWTQYNLQARFILLLTEIDKCLTPTTTTGINYIKKAQFFIKNNFNRNINIDEIAENAGVTKGYLQKLFNTNTGMSILQYLNNFRITKCKRILLETNLSIDEICSRVGFNNRQQLIYEFKIQTGMTPNAYRINYSKTYYDHIPKAGEYISCDIDGNPIF